MEPAELLELRSAIQEYKKQVAAVQGVLEENPQDQEAQQILAELAEALATAEQAYAACVPASESEQQAAHAAQQQGQHAQPQSLHQATTAGSGPLAAARDNLAEIAEAEPAETATAATAAAVVGRSTAVPAAAAMAHPRRSAPRMHPANMYCSQEPDFAALAVQYPPLAPHVSVNSATGRASIDFACWEATKQLTAALLAVDFGVQWALPEGQLVPPVPNRANYIHWMNDLLQLSAPPGAEVLGLDIGCGANFIYCLLGAALYSWHMTGVDVTQVALEGAAALRAANPHLSDLLEVRQSRCTAGKLPPLLPQQQQQQQWPRTTTHQQQQQDSSTAAEATAGVAVLGPLIGAMVDDQERFAFCMCNPPFFTSIAEANQNPNTACGGTADEMVVPGGELAFLRAMLRDSQQLRGRIHWYSSMCGKKATLKVLRQELHSAGVTALRTTELVQGKTSRWAIAWSFAASPATANMPLPRRGLQQQQQRFQRTQASVLQEQQQLLGQHDIMPGRQQRTGVGTAAVHSKVSLRVTAPAADGRKLLQSIAALLTALGNAQQVCVDTANWRVSCRLPTTSSAEEQQQQKREEQQTQQLENGDGVECGKAAEPPSKRQRAEADPPSAAGAPAVAASRGEAVGSSTVQVEVSVYQQQKGTFDVIASAVIQKHQLAQQMQRQAASAAFVSVFEMVREDLTLIWPVSPLQLL